MNVLLQWLARQTYLFYLAALLGMLGYLLAALSARRLLHAAQFTLERERVQQQIKRAQIMMGLFLLLGGLIFVVDSYVVPALPTIATPTPEIAAGLTPPATKTTTPTPTTTATLQPLQTPTPTPLGGAPPTPTTIPTPLPTAEPPDCPSPDVQIIAPATGSQLSGIVKIQGTATVNAFAYYKFEVLFPNSEMPNFIEQFDRAIENGDLGSWDISNPELYPPGGPYKFRLVTVDIYGNTTICTIPVYISSQ